MKKSQFTSKFLPLSTFDDLLTKIYLCYDNLEYYNDSYVNNLNPHSILNI